MTDDGEDRPVDIEQSDVTDVLARQREPVELTDEEILSAIRDGRR